MYKLHNVKDGVDQDCIAANENEEWKCLFAQVRNYIFNYLYMYLKTVVTILCALFFIVHLSLH